MPRLLPTGAAFAAADDAIDAVCDAVKHTAHNELHLLAACYYIPPPSDAPGIIDAAAQLIADSAGPIPIASAAKDAIRAVATSELNRANWNGWQDGYAAGYKRGIEHSNGGAPGDAELRLHNAAVVAEGNATPDLAGLARQQYTPAPDVVHDLYRAHPSTAWKDAADAYHKGIDDGYDAARYVTADAAVQDEQQLPDPLAVIAGLCPGIAESLHRLAEYADGQQHIASRQAATVERQAIALETLANSGIRTY